MNTKINAYPLSGFSKISYDELLGILYILNLYKELSEQDKNIVDLIVDGLKYREKENKEMVKE